MVPILCPLLWAACSFAIADSNPAGGSFLYQPAYCLDEMLRAPAEPYVPQPGDIVLSTDRMLFWKVTFNMALTGRPNHSGIFVARPDGRLGVLEAGPYDTLHIDVLDWLPHLQNSERIGLVWIRRRRAPLTGEESARLTAFAAAQNGKRFALVRLGGQLTPLRSRGPARTQFVGRPRGDRCSYMCSELMMEALVAAGLADPATTRPAATYPRDVFFDRSTNPYLNKMLNLSASWFPPARWTSNPASEVRREEPQ